MPVGKGLHDDYIIAWICALPLEMATVISMLNEIHDRFPWPASDENVTCPLAAVYGMTAIATVVS
jgi:hypothetical protein